MPHTSALYYPWIEVQDETWVKTAILYWDKLYTIMPASLGEYSTPHCIELHAAGLLEPVPVHPDDEDVGDCVDAALEYLTNPENPRLFNRTRVARMHPQKLHREVERALREMMDVHPDKVGMQVRRALEEVGAPSTPGWLSVEQGFAEFYMAHLAARVSARLGLASLTPSDPHEEIVQRARLRGPARWRRYDEPLPMMLRRRRRRGPRLRPEDFGEGILATLVLRGARVAEDTPLVEVLRFREGHDEQLGRLRSAIAAYATRFNEVQDVEAIVQLANDIYVTELAPQMQELEARLSESPISFVTGAIKTSALTSLASAPVTGLLDDFVGPFAIPAAIGLSVVLTGVQHIRDFQATRREHPMSYVLAAQRRFR